MTPNQFVAILMPTDQQLKPWTMTTLSDDLGLFVYRHHLFFKISGNPMFATAACQKLAQHRYAAPWWAVYPQQELIQKMVRGEPTAQLRKEYDERILNHDAYFDRWALDREFGIREKKAAKMIREKHRIRKNAWPAFHQLYRRGKWPERFDLAIEHKTDYWTTERRTRFLTSFPTSLPTK